MKSIKQFILQKLIFSEPKELDKNNPLDKFLSTLTEEEKDRRFLDFSPSQQVQYTKAMYDFQVEVMGDFSEAVFKAVTMFAVKLHKENINQFSFEQSFYGSKENLKEELFSIKFSKVDKLEEKKPMVQYDDKNNKQPRNKSDHFFNQSDMVLEIIEKLSKNFDMNPRNELPLRTSCMLLVAEFMSDCNMETMDLTLEGLSDGDINLNCSYKVECFRKEFVLSPSTYPKKKFF